MTSVVRPRISVSSAARTRRSDLESSAEVPSSRISSGAFLSSARDGEVLALAADRRMPFSPIIVLSPSGSRG